MVVPRSTTRDPPTLNVICFVEMNILLRFCLRIFDSDTVKSDCLIQIFRKMLKDLIQTVGDYLTSLTVFSGDIKKSTGKKSSENDQTLNLKKKIPVNQLMKKFWP